jgi:hypothetical protein
MADGGTDEEPLIGFAAVTGNGTAEFSRAMMRLGLTWAMAWPPHSSAAYQFTDQLATYVTARRAERGVPWVALSRYYRAVIRRVDAGARRFASREENTMLRTPPSIQWIDGPFEHVRLLTEDTMDAR